MKRALDENSTTNDRYDGLLTQRDALPPNLEGVTVGCAGPLIYAEDSKYTFHLNPATFGEVVAQEQGTFSETTTQHTDIVVIGMLEKECSKKNAVRACSASISSALASSAVAICHPDHTDRVYMYALTQDTWTDCAKHKSIKKQKTGAALKTRKGKQLHVVTFEDFIRAYNLTAWMEDNVFCAEYTGGTSRKMGPGRKRSKGTIAGLTHQHVGFMPDGKLGPPVRGQFRRLHRPFEPLDVD